MSESIRNVPLSSRNPRNPSSATQRQAPQPHRHWSFHRSDGNRSYSPCLRWSIRTCIQPTSGANSKFLTSRNPTSKTLKHETRSRSRTRVRGRSVLGNRRHGPEYSANSMSSQYPAPSGIPETQEDNGPRRSQPDKERRVGGGLSCSRSRSHGRGGAHVRRGLDDDDALRSHRPERGAEWSRWLSVEEILLRRYRPGAIHPITPSMICGAYDPVPSSNSISKLMFPMTALRTRRGIADF
jgi:hypothetical protein